MNPHGRNPYGDKGAGEAQRADLERDRDRHVSEATARRAAEEASTDRVDGGSGFRSSVRDLVAKLTRRR